MMGPVSCVPATLDNPSRSVWDQKNPDFRVVPKSLDSWMSLRLFVFTRFLNFFSFIPLFLQAVSRYMSIVHVARIRNRHFLIHSFSIMGAPC